MFKEFMGLPAHVLVVHAVVVFVPLLALVSIAYVALPRFRSRIDWALVLLAVTAPATAWVAVQSGAELTDVFTARGLQGPIVDQIAEHSRYGDLTFWYALALAVTAVVLLVVTSARPRVPKPPRWVTHVLSVAVIALAVVSLVYVALTGHSGAEAVWGNTL
ncbi:DUF2231 domain-containing protein [Salinispora cortesiana]|uniref:DUF2231 domain-containing protein n=1 Tax=Salinispora cortesiana TaxID=1305843 RepID=UPI000426F490|nr:DUF2231 domain-containing protein [Salinispora cortesiana]